VPIPPTAPAHPRRWARAALTATARRLRMPDAPPPPPPNDEHLLAHARRERATRPRWLRALFVALLAVLLAGQLGPGPVLVGGAGLVAAAATWGVLGWPARLATLAAATGWALLILGWQRAVPVAGLVAFARWFLTNPATSFNDPDPAGTAPLPGEPGQPLDPATPLAGKLTRWHEIAAAAGLAGARLTDVTVDRWGWAGMLLLRRGQTVTDAVARAAALESALDVRPRSVRLEEDPTLARRVVLRVVERDPHAQPIPWPGPHAATITQPVELGLYETGEPVRVLLLRQHALTGGIAGGGKSGVVNVIMGSLAACRDVVVWGIDRKGGMELGPWAPCLGRLATTSTVAEQLLRAAKAVIEARAAHLAARGLRTWQPSPAAPALIVLVDEHAELVDESDTAASLVEDIAQLGRAVAVTLATATQRSTVAALGSGATRAQIDVRICLRVREPRDADLILGQGMARAGWRPDRLDAPGKFLLAAPGQGLDTPRPARAYLLDDATVRQAAARYAPHRPRLDALSAAAADAASTAAAAGPASDPPSGPLDGAPDQAPTIPLGLPAGLGPAGEEPTAALVAALRAAGAAGATIADLQAATGRRRTWVYDRLADLAAAGRAEQVDRGRWRATTLDSDGDAA
jgi:S-DNA-T family DNA segregation ATPase FtsK/SpoIIIE